MELPDDLAGELRLLATKEGKSVDRYAVSALSEHAQRNVGASDVPEPPLIAEGSPEDDAALDAALSGSYHPFDVEEASRKIALRQR